MRVQVGETVTSYLKVDIVYKCSRCGKTNLSTQQISGTGYSGTILGIPLSDHHKQAQTNLQSNLKYMLESQDPMRFSSAKLNCACKYCKKREPWTNVIDSKMSPLFSACITIFSLAFIMMIANFQAFISSPGLLIFFLIILALTGGVCGYNLFSRHKEKQILLEQLSKLPAESFPTLYPYSEEIHSHLLRTIELDSTSQIKESKPVAVSKSWTCPRCKRGNTEKNTVCWSCGYEQ